MPDKKTKNSQPTGQSRRNNPEAAFLISPNINPNPVFRISGQGEIIYTNEGGQNFLEACSFRLGDTVPADWLEIVQEVLSTCDTREMEAACEERIYLLLFFPVCEVGYVSVHGRDITESKQAAETIRSLSRFPDENPNPVLRVSLIGEIIYANRGSRPLLKEWGSSTGEKLPDFWRSVVLDIAEKGDSREIEVTCDEQVFLLLFYPVEEEEYICIYGRDITKRKQAEEKLARALEDVKELKDRLQLENVYLQEEIQLEHNFSEIISSSDIFRQVLKKVEQVATTTATVLILGESGTGKELLARAVHGLSDRRDRPLVKVNCAALPSTLIESEFFGHEKGAFTGAISKKIGRFELADGGTIFLDEIGDLPLELQTKLLRVLQEGEFERLGNSKTITTDVRVIAATNHDLETSVSEKKFRADLYYRLNVFPILAPPLRDRREDIELLINHFILKFRKLLGKKIDKIPGRVLQRMQAYPWPGNVRELENVIERAMILSTGATLNVGDFQDGIIRPQLLVDNGNKYSLKENEKRLLAGALEKCNGIIEGRQGAAALLDIPPSTMRDKMKKYGLSKTHTR